MNQPEQYTSPPPYSRLELTGARLTEGGEMTSGNIQMGPDPDRVLNALKGRPREDPGARQRPDDEIGGDPT